MKILIVDDDENMRILLTRALQSRDHTVTSVANADAALDTALRETPDLILSDVVMPGMDGFELCRRIRSDKKLYKILFVLFSGVFFEKKDIEFVKSLGVSHFISKPIELKKLASELEELFAAEQQNHTNVAKIFPKVRTNEEERFNRLLTGKLYKKVQELDREKEALDAKEDQLHLITDSLPELMAEIDTDYRYIYVNSSYARTFGFLQKTIKGVHVRDVIGKSAYIVFGPRLRQAMAGEEVSFKTKLLVAPGNERHIWARCVPRPDASGKVVAVVVFMSDITHLHEVEEALHDQEVLLGSLLNSTPLILFAIDSSGIITVSEGQGLVKLGLKPGEAVGRSVYELYKDEPEILENIARALKGERFDTNITLAGRELKVSYTPRVDANGKFIGTVGVAVDETDRARLEREVVNVGSLEQERIGQDLHDSLGQTLTGINLLSKALEKKLASKSIAEAEDAQLLVQLASEATVMTKQAVSGLLPVVTEENGLQMALEDLVRKTEEIHKIKCDLDLQLDMDELGRQYSTQLYLIIREAVSNAVKHANPDIIVVLGEENNGRCVFSITDSGPGREVVPENKGGMGLNIMRYRSRMIGASLSVKLEDTGSTITCSLPKLEKSQSA